ncbi:Protocadherin gamma-A7, partial [Nestor notabilis]
EAAFHELVLRASDGGEPARTGTARIRVAVLDANDNAPVFSQAEYTVPVPEDVPVGSVLVTVTAADADEDSGANGQVRCSIGESLPFRREKTVEDYYRVVTSGQLDREKVSEYNVTVRAVDGGSPALQSSAVLALRV